MNIKKCLKNTDKGIFRYKIEFREVENYENFRLGELAEKISCNIDTAICGVKYTFHVDQPRQKNGLSFQESFYELFGRDNSTKKILEAEKSKGILNSVFDSIFNSSNSVLIAQLDSCSERRLFDMPDVGCFWYIISLGKASHADEFIKNINQNNITSDSYFIESEYVNYVMYRDYLDNSLYFGTKNIEISKNIDEELFRQRAFVKNIDSMNMFSTDYIDSIPSNTVTKHEE